MSTSICNKPPSIPIKLTCTKLSPSLKLKKGDVAVCKYANEHIFLWHSFGAQIQPLCEWPSPSEAVQSALRLKLCWCLQVGLAPYKHRAIHTHQSFTNSSLACTSSLTTWENTTQLPHYKNYCKLRYEEIKVIWNMMRRNIYLLLHWHLVPTNQRTVYILLSPPL